MSSAQPWKMDEGSGEDGEGGDQLPLGVSSEPGDEGYVGESKPKVNNSTLALFAAFAAALIVLYLLGLQNKPRQASAEEVARQAAVTSSIEEMLQNTGQGKGARIGKLLDDTNRLVQLLLGALGSKGPDVGELPGNPFERIVNEAPVVGEPEVVLPRSLDEQERLRRIAEEFGKLKLEMVMMGPRPTAMIKGQLVTVGAMVGDFFKVSDIQSTRVLLTDGKRVYELKANGTKTKP
jgi:hypothetical protein